MASVAGAPYLSMYSLTDLLIYEETLILEAAGLIDPVENMENDNMGDMMGAGFSTGMGGGSMSNRGMPYNGGMGGPGPMRNHMGGGNVCNELSVSMEIMFDNLYNCNKRRQSLRREISKRAAVLSNKTCIQTKRLNLKFHSNLALLC